MNILLQGPADPIIHACLSGDGSTLLVIRMSNAQMWNTQSGHLVDELHPENVSGHPLDLQIESWALSNHGDWVLLGMNDGTARLYASSGQEQLVLTLKEQRKLYESIKAVAFSRDGTIAMVGFSGRTVGLWEIASGELLERYMSDACHYLEQHAPETVQLSRDNRYLFACFRDLSVTVWDRLTGNTVLDEWEYAREVIDFFGDGLICRWANSGGQVWEVMRDNQTQLILDARERWQEAKFSPAGERLLVRTSDGNIKWYDTRDWKYHHLVEHNVHEGWSSYSGHRPKEGLIFDKTRNDRYVALTSPNEVSILSSLEEVPPKRIRTESNIFQVQLSPDSHVLAILEHWQALSLWSIEGESLAKLDDLAHISAYEFSPDSTRLAVGGRTGGKREWVILIWDLSNYTHVNVTNAHRGQIGALAFAADGRTLISMSADASIRLWNLETSVQPVRTLRIQRPLPTRLKTLPNGEILIAGYDRLERWDTKLEEKLSVFPIRETSPWCLTTDYSSILETESWSHQVVRYWDLQSGDLRGICRSNVKYPDVILREALEESSIPEIYVWFVDGNRFIYSGHRAHSRGSLLCRYILSRDEEQLLLPTHEGAYLIKLGDKPSVLKAFEFDGSYKTGCITDREVIIVNDRGTIFRFAL